MPKFDIEKEPYRPLGSTRYRCHPIGFGSYRILEGNARHETALREYLDRGGNLIDTSANYGDGRSETLIGKVLQDYPRESVILVTKGGYIQGQNMALALRSKFPEVVEYGEGIWHSIHPDFLATQIERSAERMKVSSIDVYLLHNPEYYLEDQAHRKGVGKAEQDEFYRRIREAFRFLESKVEEGKIGCYGISSNNFGFPATRPTATSVERCLQEAAAVSANHRFRVVQLPMNLFEAGGAVEPNNSGKTVLEFCRDNGLGVLLNRPLNAFFSGQMVRLADFVRPGEQAPGKEQLLLLLDPLRRMEDALEKQFDIPLIYGEQKGIANYLAVIVPQINSLSHWEEVIGEYVVQPIQRWATECQQLYGHMDEWRSWWQEFATKLSFTFEEIARYLATSQQPLSDTIRDQLFLAGYSNKDESLSRLAQNVLMRLDGVSCVLSGMRRSDYVKDSMGVVDLEPVDALSILRNFARLNQGDPLHSIQ